MRPDGVRFGHFQSSLKRLLLLLLLLQSPGEIKTREVSWTLTKKLAQKRPRAGRWCWARERERESWTSFASVVSQRRSYGHCLCGSVLHSSWDSNCVVRWLLRNAGWTLPINILLFWRRSTAALVFRVGACLEVSLFCPPFFTRPRP